MPVWARLSDPSAKPGTDFLGDVDAGRTCTPCLQLVCAVLDSCCLCCMLLGQVIMLLRSSCVLWERMRCRLPRMSVTGAHSLVHAEDQQRSEIS